jgi:hypothetical protein
LRIIWPNFLRVSWHIGATQCPTAHKAFGRRFDPSTVTCSSRLISRIRRIPDQNRVQKSNVFAGDSDDRLPNIEQKSMPSNSQSDKLQRIFSSATRRETLGKHLKGDRRGGELKIDWTKPRPRA